MNTLDHYNIAYDCIDKHAASLHRKHHTALISVEENATNASLKETRLSFSALEGLTNRMANAMQARGLQAHDRVILRLSNRVEFPISFLAIIKCGAIPIPSSPLFTWKELTFLLQDSEARFLITEDPFLLEELKKKNYSEKAIQLKEIWNLCTKESPLPTHIFRWQDMLKQGQTQFSLQETAAKNPAYWLYTSGTTGTPKAAIHSHASIRAHDDRIKVWQNLKDGDIIFNTSALNWSYALTAGLLDIWRHGQTALIYQGKLEAERLCHLLHQYKVTTLMSVPGIYRRLNRYLMEHPQKFSRLRVCLSAGEFLKDQTEESFYQLTGRHIYQGLGMTEHSVYLVQAFGEDKSSGALGRPLPGQKVTLRNKDLKETQVGEIGTLATHHSCEGLFLGYHQKGQKDPKLPLSENWFLSGDLAKRDAAGNFTFLGRKDDILTVGGYKISPLEIEQVLQRHPQVIEAAVLAKSVKKDTILLHAYVVLDAKVQGNEELAKHILNFCKKSLAAYKLPRQITWMKALPKTARGKLDRRALFID